MQVICSLNARCLWSHHRYSFSEGLCGSHELSLPDLYGGGTATGRSASLQRSSPSITDVTVAALCHGRDQCGTPLYVSGAQSFVVSIASMLVTPLIGSLSDRIGRKPFIVAGFACGGLPIVVLALGETVHHVYLYYFIGTISGVIGGHGALRCVSNAFVADMYPVEKRALAFGGVGSCFSIGFLAGTMLASALPSSQWIFTGAVAIEVAAALYCLLLLPESLPRPQLAAPTSATSAPLMGTAETLQPHLSAASAPLLGSTLELPELSGVHDQVAAPIGLPKPSAFRSGLHLVSQSPLLMYTLGISFLHSMAESGRFSTSQYYLKAKFHFAKDQFARMMLISGCTSIFTQILILPFVMRHLPAQATLVLSMLVGAIDFFLLALARKPWVAYATSALFAVTSLSYPTLSAIMTSGTPAHQQGQLQGIVVAIGSVAGILSALLYSPLTAYFLSDSAPFSCPGIGILVGGCFMVMAVILGLLLPPARPCEVEACLEEGESIG